MTKGSQASARHQRSPAALATVRRLGARMDVEGTETFLATLG
jgi:hypothetical protein